MEPPRCEPHRLARAEDPPGIEERHHLEHYDLELGRGRDPEDYVACLDSAQQLPPSREPAIMVAAQRAVPAHGDERSLARFHLLLRRERWVAAHPFHGQPSGEHHPQEMEASERPFVAVGGYRSLRGY